MRPIAIVASSVWVSSIQLLKLFNRVRDSSSFRLSLYHVYAYYSYKFLYVESCSCFIYMLILDVVITTITHATP